MSDNLFEEIKQKILNVDPVHFTEKYLTLDGGPFTISNNGWRPFADIYRYVGLKAVEPSGKPMIIVASRQVGKTTMAAMMECYFLASDLYGVENKRPVRIMHLFPTIGHAEAFSKTKLDPILNGSILTFPKNNSTNQKMKRAPSAGVPYMISKLDATLKSSLTFKKFNNNTIEIQSTGMDGDRIRGRTADIIFFDEVQDMRREAIGNASKILTQAKLGAPGLGVQIYFGTAKKKGSDFHKMWAQSNQQYYYLGCSNCKKHFPLYTPESDDWENTWITDFTVKCCHCNFEQDKRDAAENGKWVSLSKNENINFVGFHINQLYMPTFSKEAILRNKPGIHPTNTEKVYQNEVLGEFYQGDSSPLDIDEIYEKCGDRDRKMRAFIQPGEEKMVVMGVDYGSKNDIEQLSDPEKSKAGKSYTTVVIISVKGAGICCIELAIKLKRNDIEYKKSLLTKLMTQYSVDIVVGDIGHSNDFSPMMHREHGEKYIVSRAQSKISAPGHARYVKNLDVPEIQFERDYYISEMFEKLKQGAIRFPLKDYDKIAWMVEQCCSMEMKPNIPKYGEPSIHYVKGSLPNDSLMSLINAYLGYKYLITNGFNVTNPLLQDNKLNKKDAAIGILGYIKF